ncbi:hypothetical protein GALL_203380 [mine drainage metagenome]|uniref:Uncharacterized protein n=1 Tax=mine drainage metagenome TaxID=410659 RepID=A0A1J5SBX5_9ZZZZ
MRLPGEAAQVTAASISAAPSKASRRSAVATPTTSASALAPAAKIASGRPMALSSRRWVSPPTPGASVRRSQEARLSSAATALGLQGLRAKSPAATGRLESITSA